MRKLIAFVHIEKAAGTSLLYLLRRNWLGRYMDVRPLAPRSGEQANFTAADLRGVLRVNPAVQVIGGHAVVPWADLDSVAPQIRYITLLREPYSRYLSQFHYWNRSLDKGWSFERFLDHEASYDFQTRKIAGTAVADDALRMLRERFLVVGLVEQFNRFLLELTAALAPHAFDPHYRQRNVGSGASEDYARLMDRFGDEIRERNRADARLYERVSAELLAQQAADYPGALDADLARFEAELAARPAASVDLPLLVDASLRKLWYEPVTGLVRRLNGLPARGSY